MSKQILKRGVLRALAAMALLAIGASCVSADDDRSLGPANCRFARPGGWDEQAVRWEGECLDGRAHGLGALRAFAGSRATRIFFGRMKAGDLDLGVIDLPEGYAAGRFEAGKLLKDDDRSVFVKAFAEASAAARHVAERFSKAGNTGSARFYLDKAKQLEQQMD